MRWFKNLKKWQKGGLIGCGVGLFFIILMIPPLILRPSQYPELLALPFGLNFLFHLIPYLFSMSEIMTYFTASAAMVVFYGGLGAIMGRTQQMTNPVWKWALTILLALILLFIWFVNVVLAIMWSTQF